MNCNQLLSASSSDIVAKLQEFIAIYLTPALAAAALEAHQLPVESSSKWSRAVQLGFCHVIRCHSEQVDLLRKFDGVRGVMKEFYRDDISSFGGFISRYPQAIDAIHIWSQQQETVNPASKLIEAASLFLSQGGGSPLISGSAGCVGGDIHHSISGREVG